MNRQVINGTKNCQSEHLLHGTLNSYYKTSQKTAQLRLNLFSENKKIFALTAGPHHLTYAVQRVKFNKYGNYTDIKKAWQLRK